MIALVVDPNTNMQSVVGGMLRSMMQKGKRIFSEVKKASNFSGAWTMTDPIEEIEVVVCEVDLAGRMEGIKFLKECRSNAQRKHLPFIMTTGSAADDIVPALIGATREWGAFCLLVKPFAQVVLEERVHGAINKARSSEEVIYRKIGSAPPQEALATIDRLEETGFSGAKLSNIAGEKHLEAGDMQKAAERFERAVAESEAAYLTALRNHATIQEEFGNHEEVIMALEKLDKLSPLDVDRKVKLGGLYLQMGQEEKGRGVLDRAIVLARRCGEEAAVKSKVDSILAVSDAEEPEFKKIRENPQDLKMCNEVALRLRKEGKYERAEACYDFILSYHPNHPSIMYNKAVLFVARERYRDAISILENVISQSPQFVKAVETLDLCRNKVEAGQTR